MENKNQFILAIDQSTQTTKAIIVGQNGKIHLSKRLEHKQIITNKNYIEHDPLEILNNTKILIKETVEEFCTQNNIAKSDIKCMGITNQRETLVVWDKITQKPLYNAIVWNDCRTIQMCNEFIKKYGNKNFFQQKNGLLIDSYFSMFKFLWLLENVEQIKEKYIKKELMIGTIDSWLIFNLTKEKNHFTDVSNASRTFLMNLKSLDWDQEICDEFQICKSILPSIKPNTFNFGTLNLFGLEHIQITGSLGDQQAAALGMGLCNGLKNQAKITYGTGIFMLISTNENIVNKEGLLTTVIYKDKDRIFYGLEGAIETGGQTLSVLEKNMGLKVWDLDKEVQKENDFFRDEILIGSFGRLMAPFWRNTQGGMICNLSYESSSKDIYRAMLESIAFRVVQCMNLYDVELDEIKIDGGMAKNKFLMNFQSLMLKKELKVFQNKDCTVLGAALAAGLYEIVNDQQEFLQQNLSAFEKIQQQCSEKEYKILEKKFQKFDQKIAENWDNQLQ